VQTIRIPVSYNPLRKKNFYPMHAPHIDEPPIPKSRRALHHADRIPYKRSYLEHALLALQSYPQFSRRQLYLFYTQKMPQRPPLEHFPYLPSHCLKPEGLKEILRKNRWPV
jgi:hypothetical protein